MRFNRFGIKRSPIDISLSEAQERMRRLLGTKPADVTTTCVEPGTTPRRVIPALSSRPVLSLPTRQSIIAELDRLSQLASSINDDDLACALRSCVKPVTEGRLVMSQIAHDRKEKESEESTIVDNGHIPDWTM